MRWVLGLAALAVAAGAHGETWTIDPPSSSARFSVTAGGVEAFSGVVPNLGGTVEMDGGSLLSATVRATLDPGLITTGDADRDGRLHGDGLLDVKAHPVANFTSSRVQRHGRGLLVGGAFELRGVTREIVLEVERLLPPMTDPAGVVHLVATAKVLLHPSDFGLDLVPLLAAPCAATDVVVEAHLAVELRRESSR